MDNTTTTTPRVDARAYRLAQLRHRVRWLYNSDRGDEAIELEGRLHDLMMEAHKRGDLFVLMDRIAELDGATFIATSNYFTHPDTPSELMDQLTKLLTRNARDLSLPDPDYTFDVLLAICYVGSHDHSVLDADIVIDESLYAHDPDDPDDTVVTNLFSLFHRLAREADVAMQGARQFVRDIEASR